MHRHTWTHAQRASFELTHTCARARTHLHPPLSGPVEGHAFVSRCQDAGVCSCASRSIRFIFFSRGCPFVCGPVSFQPTPISPREDTSVSVLLQTHRRCVLQKKNTTFLPSQRYLNASTQPSSFHLSGIDRSYFLLVLNETTLFRSVLQPSLLALCMPHYYLFYFIFFCNAKEEFLQNGIKKGTWQ